MKCAVVTKVKNAFQPHFNFSWWLVGPPERDSDVRIHNRNAPRPASLPKPASSEDPIDCCMCVPKSLRVRESEQRLTACLAPCTRNIPVCILHFTVPTIAFTQPHLMRYLWLAPAGLHSHLQIRSFRCQNARMEMTRCLRRTHSERMTSQHLSSLRSRFLKSRRGPSFRRIEDGGLARMSLA